MGDLLDSSGLIIRAEIKKFVQFNEESRENMERIEKYSELCQKLYQGEEEAWEHRLFIEVAITNYLWMEKQRKQSIVFWTYQNEENRINSSNELLDFVKGRLSIIKEIGMRAAKCLKREVNASFGADGEPGNAQEIVCAGEKFMSSYQELLDLKTSLKFIDARDSYKNVVEEMENVIESMCKSFDVFYQKLLVARHQFENLLAGKIRGEDLCVDLSFSVMIETERLMELVTEVLK